MHIEVGQSLGSTCKAKEVSFEFRAKDSLGEEIAHVRGKGIPHGGTGDCKCPPAKDKTQPRYNILSSRCKERSGP